MSRLPSAALSRPVTQSHTGDMFGSPSSEEQGDVPDLRPSSSASSSSDADDGPAADDALLGSVAPRAFGTIVVEVNGRRRDSIVEYIRREDDERPASRPGPSARASDASQPAPPDLQWSSDDEADDADPAKRVDAFYTDLEHAAAERRRVRERQQEERDELDRLREDDDAPPSSTDLIPQPRLSISASSSNAAPSPAPPSRAVARSSLTLTPSGSRRPSRLASPLPEPRTHSRGSVTGKRSRLSTAKPGKAVLPGEPTEPGGLRPIVLLDGGGRRRMDRQLVQVKRSIEEVEAALHAKMERERERERLQRERHDSREAMSAELAEATATVHRASIASSQPLLPIDVGEHSALVLRTDSKPEGPFAALLANLSFSNTLLPLTDDELHQLSLPAPPTTPPSPSALALPPPSSLLPPSSPPPLHYRSCFPDWLSSRPDFTSFISQTQLLCLHVAEKAADKRTQKDLAKLSGFLASFPFFARFSAHTLGELSRTCWLERRKRGERVDSQGEDGSVMRFVYEGRVSYETSIARLFRRKRQEQEREEAQRKRDQPNAKARIGDRARGAMRASLIARRAQRGLDKPSASTVVSPLGGQQRGRSASALTSAQTVQATTSASVPHTASGVRSRATTAMGASLTASTGGSGHAPATPALASDIILSNALTFNPADHAVHLPSLDALSSPSSSSLDDLLLSHTLTSGGTFGESLLFNHFFSSYSFSQIYRLKQQQRLHALLGKNLQQPRWGVVRLLVRSLMEQKSSLHIHSVDCVSEDVIFLCWKHADLDAIAAEGRRYDAGEMLGALRALPFFAGWPFSAVQDTAARAEVKTYAKGEVVVREGEPTNAVLFIVEGRVEVAKHVSVERAERWPAGSKAWEVTRTQRVRRHVVGWMEESDVIGVEGVCGVGLRDFEVRVVSEEGCTCFVVKRVAFAQWAAMKKVLRECRARMLDWRDRAMREVERQAQQSTAASLSPPEDSTAQRRPTVVPAPAAVEEEKTQLQPEPSSPSSFRPHAASSAVVSLPPIRRAAARHAAPAGETVAERRKRLKAEEAARVRKGDQRNEEYWMDRVWTVEKMQEEKRRRIAAARSAPRRTSAAPPPAVDDSGGEVALSELPLMAETKEPSRLREADTAVSGGVLVRVRRVQEPIDLQQTKAVVSRSVDAHRQAPTMSSIISVFFQREIA